MAQFGRHELHGRQGFQESAYDFATPARIYSSNLLPELHARKIAPNGIGRLAS